MRRSHSSLGPQGLKTIIPGQTLHSEKERQCIKKYKSSAKFKTRSLGWLCSAQSSFPLVHRERKHRKCRLVHSRQLLQLLEKSSIFQEAARGAHDLPDSLVAACELFSLKLPICRGPTERPQRPPHREALEAFYLQKTK